METQVSSPLGSKTMDFTERVRRRNEFDASVVYGTRHFNLMTKRVEHHDFRKINDDHWLNPETGIIYDKYARERTCPLCEVSEFQTLFVKSGFPHVKCHNCDLVFVTPILIEDEYRKLWQAEDSWEEVLESTEQIKMQSLEAGYSLDIAGLYMEDKEDIRICDVGCGPGTLLNVAKQRGYQVFGVEPNRRCHKFLDEMGVDYLPEFFPLSQEIPHKFDCIFTLNTLEHLHDPLQIVLEMKKLLLPKGLIYISVPNINALVNRIMHEKAGVFGGHSHVTFFNAKTLTLLLENAGFEVLEYETIITEIGVIKNFLSYKDPYFGDQADVLDIITPELIYKSHLARNVNLVGRLKL